MAAGNAGLLPFPARLPAVLAQERCDLLGGAMVEWGVPAAVPQAHVGAAGDQEHDLLLAALTGCPWAAPNRGARFGTTTRTLRRASGPLDAPTMDTGLVVRAVSSRTVRTPSRPVFEARLNSIVGIVPSCSAPPTESTMEGPSPAGAAPAMAKESKRAARTSVARRRSAFSHPRRSMRAPQVAGATRDACLRSLLIGPSDPCARRPVRDCVGTAPRRL